MKHLRIKTIMGSEFFLTFLSIESRDKSQMIRDFLNKNIKIINTESLKDLYREITTMSQEVKELDSTQVHLNYSNSIRAISNESNKRRRKNRYI